MFPKTGSSMVQPYPGARMHFPDEGAGGKCNKDWLRASLGFGKLIKDRLSSLGMG